MAAILDRADELARIGRPWRGQGPRDIRERAADWAGQVERTRRRLHSPVAAFEERIVEQVAQPIERLAHRRLADPVMSGRASDVSFGNQRVKYDQQIEIDAA